MVRVKASEAFDLSKYEYWWGLQKGWKAERLTTFTSETATLWGTGQGQIVWNELYQCYIFVHLGESPPSCVNFCPFTDSYKGSAAALCS